ncbi:MAG: recombinase family protein [Alphaproteobacteria bacterium]|nr:recombinase family protein [Alphaproteobacteria bacterium]
MKQQKIDFSGPCEQAIIWARVSKKEQKEGVSTDAQIKDTTSYCNAKKFVIIKTFDVAESSTRGKRPEFNQMLDLVRAQPCRTAIVVHCIDRFQRRFNECAEIETLMREGRLEVHFYKEGLVLDKNSAYSDIMRWDMGILAAKMYVGALRENVKRSMNYNWERGIWQGKAPVGYVNIPKTEKSKPFIELDPERAPLVKRMFEEYAKGGHTLKTMGKLVREMNLCVRGSKVPMKKNQIHRTLTNPFYYGIMRINGKLIPHVYEKLIDKPLWDRVQEVLEGRARPPFNGGYGKLPYSLRGLVRCSTCGYLMTPETKTKKSGKQYTYLKCNHSDGVCRQKPVNEKLIFEQLDVEVFDRIRIPETTLGKLKKNVSEYIKKRTELDESTKRSLNLRIIANKDMKDKLLDFYLKGKIDENTYNVREAEIAAEKAELNDMLAKYKEIDGNIIVKVEKVLDFAANIGKLIKSPNCEVRRQLLGLILSDCFLEGKKLRFTILSPISALVKEPQKEKWCG